MPLPRPQSLINYLYISIMKDEIMTPLLLRDIHLYTKDVVSWLEFNNKQTEAKILTLSFIFIKQRFEKHRYNSNAVHAHVNKLVQYLEERGNMQAAKSLLKQFCIFNDAWNHKNILFSDEFMNNNYLSA